jgi:hypothetical protein
MQQEDVRILVATSNFSLLPNVQTDSGAHPHCYSMGAGAGVLSRGKQPEREVNHSSPTSAKVKKEWSYTCISPARLHGMDRESFTFYLPSYDTIFLCFEPAKSGMLFDVLQLCFCPQVTIETRVRLLIHSQTDIFTRICHWEYHRICLVELAISIKVLSQ